MAHVKYFYLASDTVTHVFKFHEDDTADYVKEEVGKSDVTQNGLSVTEAREKYIAERVAFWDAGKKLGHCNNDDGIPGDGTFPTVKDWETAKTTSPYKDYTKTSSTYIEGILLVSS